MSILNERIALDTNVFLLGLRKAHPPSERLLTHLDHLRLVRHFLGEITGFPFRILSPEEALTEIEAL